MYAKLSPCLTKDHAQYAARLFAWRYPTWADLCNGRMERAVEITVKPYAIKYGDLPGAYMVTSSSGQGCYLVNLPAKSCTCPDSTGHPGVICKHRLAVAYMILSPEWHWELFQARLKVYDRINQLATELENLRPEDYGGDRYQKIYLELNPLNIMSKTLDDLYYNMEDENV